MRVAVVLYEPEWYRRAQRLGGMTLTEEQSAEQFAVTFDGKVVDPNHYALKATIHPEMEGETTEAILNWLWRVTQNDFHPHGWYRAINPESESQEGFRSTMIGDLFAIDGRWFVVERHGFGDVPEEQARAFTEAFIK